ncbi:peroxidase-related enzyme [Pseudonocardia endophytica]|uniref:Putative peroxidase-related enzyme n=1 Tax=Pseudonocardia endophytica TaxID=401976 RepID=A0A4R1HJM2_PSEEN|nr:peroxidase-related enzyme [Pseudonocardia endophytica]TCK22058.1 putative peroxidase-related enzyme [Pseudonocardia endophytica]
MTTLETKPGARISRLRVPAREELSPAIATFFDRTEAAEGHVPNWLSAFALGGAGFTRLNDYLFPLLLGSPDSKAQLTLREREILATVVSVANRCSYCHALHVDGLGKVLGDHRLAHRIGLDHREVEELSDRERLLADLAVTITHTPGEVSDARIDELRAAGLSDEDVYEAVQIISIINATNRIAIALGVLPDAELFGAPSTND